MTVKNWKQTEIGSDNQAAYAWTARANNLDAFWPHGGNWAGLLEAIQKKPALDLSRRKKVAQCIRIQYADGGLELPAAIERFEKGAEVVTTGHQLQIGGGPAYFHYKILSALRWAKRMQRHGVDAVAVFWMASEDHDFEEISSVHQVNGEPFIWRPTSETGDVPVGRLMWSAEDEAAWQEWASKFSDSSPHSENKIDTGCPLSNRVRQWVHAWFPNEPLIVIDGDDAELKGLASPLWEAEWSGAGIGQILANTIERYEQAQGKSPIHAPELNLFVLDEQGKRIRADRWLKNTVEAKPLRPADNSPNVALRPLYQEWLLESSAFVGGPAEVSYWLLLRGAFEKHGLTQPALLLRDGALVLDETSFAVCQQLNWLPGQGCWSGDEAVAHWLKLKLAEKGNVQEAWSQWSKALEAYAQELSPLAVPTTTAHLAKSEKELAQLEKKWRKILREANRVKCEEIASVFDQKICPHGKMQERTLNVMELALACGGWDELKRLWFEACENETEPQYLVFEPR